MSVFENLLVFVYIKSPFRCLGSFCNSVCIRSENVGNFWLVKNVPRSSLLLKYVCVVPRVGFSFGGKANATTR